MTHSKVDLKKKAAALKTKLKKAAAVAEQIRLDHEQAAQEAADLEAALASEIPAQAVEEEELFTPPAEPEPSPEIKRSLWHRFLDSF